MDNVDSSTRSKMMSKIKSKNTKPEITIRKRLFARGYRYSLHSKKLSGKPDIVLTKYRVAIFVNGCFWHMHNCNLFVLPKTRTEFWQQKLSGNKIRDERNIESLLTQGWRVATVWECSIKNKKDPTISMIIDQLDDWIKNSRQSRLEIPNGENE